MAFVSAEAQLVPRPNRPGEHPGVGDLLSFRIALDLEDEPGGWGLRVAVRRRQELLDSGGQGLHAGAGQGGTDVHGMHEHLLRLRSQFGEELRIRRLRLVFDVRGEDPVVVLRQRLGQPGSKRGVVSVERLDACAAGAERVRAPHPHDRRSQALRDRVHGALVVGARAVDLVHEQERRNAQPLQGAHEDARLGLDALDRRDDQHGAVEHVQDTFNLGDEVGVARGVDQVDVDAAERERGDGRPDGDAAPALELQRVGLRGSGIDAADFVDDAGFEEKPLREGCLTGVYMRQDSEVELFLRHASFLPS